MMKAKILAALLGLIAAQGAYAAFVTDGSFDLGAASGNYTTYNAGQNMGGWHVDAGSVDLIKSYWTASDGTQSVDMAGYFANGTISQVISGLTVGQTYLLSFDMAGNPDNQSSYPVKTLGATLFGTQQVFTFNTTGKTRTAMGWTTISAYFTADATSTTLMFKDLSIPAGTAFGAAVDNVSISAVPEPATMLAGALLLLPFGASTLRRMRKI